MGAGLSFVRNEEDKCDQPSGKPHDPYETVEQIKAELRCLEQEACQLILGVDFTESNRGSGKRSFGGKCLHDTSGGHTPYSMSIDVIGRTLGQFDDDKKIPCFGFGDRTAAPSGLFSFNKDNRPVMGLNAVVERYKEITKVVELFGPTCFSPLIQQAMQVVVNSGMKFHILLIIADGSITPSYMPDTINAIRKACEVPMSIVMIGVGDGPWDNMRNFDDHLPERDWDNFQFVEFQAVYDNPELREDTERADSFAKHVLMEIPEQYKQCGHLIRNKAKKKELDERFRDKNILVLDPPEAIL